MKKIAPIVMVAFIGALSLTSCKKEYTCSCSYTVNGQTTTSEVKSGTKLSKKDAKAWCTAYTNAAWTGLSCSLK